MKVVCKMEVTLRSKARKQSIERCSESKMWDGAQVFNAVVLLLDRIRLYILLVSSA